MVALITVLSGLAWLIGLGLAWYLRHTEAAPSLELDARLPLFDRLAAVAARGTGAFVGALVAGVLVIGGGGRLMMRVLAAASPDHVQGLITDMDATVGRVTLAGSLGFVLFVGAGAGVIGWLLRLVTRRVLPRRSVVAGFIGAGLGGGLLARPSSLLEPSSHDFAILSPVWLAVVLILALIASFGILLAQVSDWLAPRWPVPQRPGQVWRLAPLATLVLLPPIALGALAVALVRARLVEPIEAGWMQRVDALGPRAVLVAGMIGGAWTLAAGVEILIGAA